MNKTPTISRRRFVQSAAVTLGTQTTAFAYAASAHERDVSGANVTDIRERWLNWVERVSEPVLVALSRRELRRTMPVEAVAGHEQERAVGTHLEALGRLLAGLAPWLGLDPTEGESSRETRLRARYRGFAQEAIASAVDPASPDYMRFGESGQTLVDSSFLSLALLRAPKQLLDSLGPSVRQQLVKALGAERKIQPPYTNWLLFAALNEVLLKRLGASWDRLRLDYAFHSLENWYLGDGVYGDGPQFHADYYNSYVIQPYLLALMDGLEDERTWKPLYEGVVSRARRYAVIQERSIAADGSFPPIGRSITYRAGAFHLLADIARRDALPTTLQPAAVRGALTAVQARTLDAQGTFGAGGWLQIGLAGHQLSLAETYISTGSLYLCSAAWLPLGLPPTSSFWTAADADWTQKAIWSGANAHADHALSDD